MLSMPYIICPGTEFYAQILEATKASLVKISHTRKFTARVPYVTQEPIVLFTFFSGSLRLQKLDSRQRSTMQHTKYLNLVYM
jgi:hypothetical protein